jgi:checkpoint serine/threonine-protein kinase
VNLEAVYPDPEDPTSEMSLEELRATHRGWLQKKWSPETVKAPRKIPIFMDQENDPIINDNTKAVSSAVSEKLVIPRDSPMFDENGAAKSSARPGKSRKMKTMEVNETQISKKPPIHNSNITDL